MNMKKNVLMRTNLFVCFIIVLGFIITSLISYNSNQGLFKSETENVSNLTSEGICHRIDSIFSKPISVSLTMANDSLLKEFLLKEETNQKDQLFIRTMREYLHAYKDKYNFDSVFLVSAKTHRYYNFNGLDRTLIQGDPENVWYFTQLDSSEEYSLNIDNDEVATANNDITVFINCKIRDEQGTLMGIVGVGFRVNYIQAIFKEYEEGYNIKAYLVDNDGNIQVSTNKTGYERTDLFANSGYPELKETIIANKDGVNNYWYSKQDQRGFLVTQYIPNLGWHLIVENDIAQIESQMQHQFYVGMVIIILVILSVLIIITRIIQSYNKEIVRLTVEEEKKRSSVFRIETEKIYENIYEIDITHNRAASEATVEYFKSLGVPKDTPYDRALHIIAQKQIKQEFQQGYINTFSLENILGAYEKGEESLCYDFMISNDDGISFYWMRITARIFYWDEDKSVRIFVYRQNVNEEKNHEKQLLEKMEKDSLTGLYNKAATQYHIQNALRTNAETMYAFFIFDIDNFKQVNDSCGHDFGDKVITGFAEHLKSLFRSEDIVGRIGGDEFVVFVPVPSKDWASSKAASLVQKLRYEYNYAPLRWDISVSIGVAVSPQSGEDFDTLYRNADNALYNIKRKGKNGFNIFGNY